MQQVQVLGALAFDTVPRRCTALHLEFHGVQPFVAYGTYPSGAVLVQSYGGCATGDNDRTVEQQARAISLTIKNTVSTRIMQEHFAEQL